MISMNKIINKNLIIICFILITLSLLFTFRYLSINQKYPDPINKEHKLNQPIKYGSFEIKTIGYKMMNSSELKDLGSVFNEITTPYDKNIKCVIATVNIKNSGTEQKNLEVYPFQIESGGFSNGIDAALFSVLNGEDSTLVPILKPNEEKKLLLPFTMIKSQFSKKDWEQIDYRKFQLVLSLYPEKNFVVLN
jgi:hypothetical protein